MNLRLAFTGVLGTILVTIASLLSYGLDYFCIDDTASRTSVYCQNGGAPQVVVPRLLILLGLPLLTAYVAVVAVKRGQYWPILLMSILCLPLTGVLPEVLIGY
ncbi:MAG TPA: hypothetical protein VK691_03795 [Solirubrobacteraceae bacterium]|jgi:hypothetical protein|nr:hypothetical protein [Solirubrobacteraceae bacterium]